MEARLSGAGPPGRFPAPPPQRPPSNRAAVVGSQAMPTPPPTPPPTLYLCARCGREIYQSAPVRMLCLGCAWDDRAAWLDGRAAPAPAVVARERRLHEAPAVEPLDPPD